MNLIRLSLGLGLNLNIKSAMLIIYYILLAMVLGGCSRQHPPALRLEDVMHGSIMIYYAKTHYSNGDLQIIAAAPYLYASADYEEIYRMGDVIDIVKYSGPTTEFPEGFLIFIKNAGHPPNVHAYIPIVRGKLPTLFNDDGRALSFDDVKAELENLDTNRKIEASKRSKEE